MSIQDESSASKARELLDELEERRRNRSLYEKAKPLTLDRYLTNQAIQLVVDTFEQVTGDSFRGYKSKVVEIHGWRSGEQLKCLLVYKDGTRIFVGEDDTATNAGRFCFVINPEDGDPSVRTVDEALDLLKPPEVTEAALSTDSEPGRQGEWWIIPTDETPAGSEFKPGVGSRPYGGSPLENHVPREYGLGVPDDVFMQRFRDVTGIEKAALETPHDVFDWAFKQATFHDDPLIGVPDNVPTVRDLRDLADSIYVKGTLRHRENDHYLERIGDEWHLAVTHGVEVYTPSAPDDIEQWTFEEQDNGLYVRKTNPVWRRRQRRRRARLD